MIWQERSNILLHILLAKSQQRLLRADAEVASAMVSAWSGYLRDTEEMLLLLANTLKKPEELFDKITRELDKQEKLDKEKRSP